jgi:hypothetical protein
VFFGTTDNDLVMIHLEMCPSKLIGIQKGGLDLPPTVALL